MGFLSAKDILAIAAAPSFRTNTRHDAIARNVLEPPIEDWQRPLNQGRVDGIKRFFDNTGEIMPNPVLLSVNALSSKSPLELKRERLAGGVETDLWLGDVARVRGTTEKPLWILDGQHRITGLAKSAQAGNMIPFVLLINQGMETYRPETFAKLFAQVTTSAEPLDPLHNEWLTFGFRLGNYSPTVPNNRAHRDSMRATASLCDIRTLERGKPNPFFNKIRFNPFPREAVVRPDGGGFEYTCQDLKEMLRSEYYEVIQEGPRLTPDQLARQVGLAYRALQQSVTGNHIDTVFFGEPGGKGQKPMQDAFLVGVLARLRKEQAPDWLQLLEDLNFPDTDWNFSGWIETVGGAAGTLARKIALGVFRLTFSAGSLPKDNATMTDFLQGNTAGVTIAASHLTEGGRPSTADRMEFLVTPGVRTHDIGKRRHLKLKGMTSNVGKVKIVEARAPLADRFSSRLRTGVTITARDHSPIKLLFRLEHYGGTSQEATATIRWSS